MTSRPRRAAVAAAAAAVACAGLVAGRPTAAQGPIEPVEGALVDYAPSGMPDFSACRAEWSRAAAEPDRPGQWTFGAPVALANALWWLDARAEPRPAPPPAVHDAHALVTAYPSFGPPRDDHDGANVGPLVEDLAGRLNTDGRARPGAGRGTAWEDFVAGAEDYVTSRRLRPGYAVAATVRPDGAWLRVQQQRGAAVVVLLGVWESSGDGWRRIGGAYAALAGTDAAGAAVALADPVYDQAVRPDNGGRLVPADGARHSCRNAPRDHDDAAVVSHDRYDLFPPPGLPGGGWALGGYFRPDSFGDGAAFAGLNGAAFLAGHAGDWQRGTLVAALDAALALQPQGGAAGGAPSPTAPTAPPAATDEPTAPPSSTDAPATPTPRPEATATLARPTEAPLGERLSFDMIWLPALRNVR